MLRAKSTGSPASDKPTNADLKIELGPDCEDVCIRIYFCGSVDALEGMDIVELHLCKRVPVPVQSERQIGERGWNGACRCLAGHEGVW